MDTAKLSKPLEVYEYSVRQGLTTLSPPASFDGFPLYLVGVTGTRPSISDSAGSTFVLELLYQESR
jgi:hypothetical protein